MLLFAQLAMAQPNVIKPIARIEVENTGPAGTPVCVPLSVPFAELTNISAHVVVRDKGPQKGIGAIQLPAQLTQPGLLTEKIPVSAQGGVRRDLHFQLPTLDVKNLEIVVLPEKAGTRFAWKTQPGEYAELLSNTTPVARYICKPYDNSSTANRDKTYKVFHHLYDPAATRFITNGGDTNEPMPKNPKDNLYPHHRGLMYAFKDITFDGNKKCDTWHAKPGDTHESHEGFLSSEAGSVLGRHRVAIDWHGPSKEVFAKEERELTFYKIGNGTLVEFASRLKSPNGLVKLQGDPQHSGFQFRAHNDLHEQKNDKLTYYLRPDGKGALDETRNWDAKAKDGGKMNKLTVNLPWDAMSFVVDGKRYTAAYFNNPSNPGESRWSERDYGRFGCYFEYDLTPDRPLVVNYRVWLQDGEMTGEQVAAMSKAFVQPPKVTVK
jgi:hypothetical protein